MHLSFSAFYELPHKVGGRTKVDRQATAKHGFGGETKEGVPKTQNQSTYINSTNIDPGTPWKPQNHLQPQQATLPTITNRNLVLLSKS